MHLEHLKKDYLEYLEVERNRSLKTIENYEHYLVRFLKWAKIEKPSEITADLVRNYRIYLNRLTESGPLKKQTQNYHLIALRNFLKYLARRDIESLSAEKIELGKNPSRDLEFMEEDELHRLLAAPTGDKLKALRDRAILELFFSTGLRLSELAHLNRDSVNLKKGEFSVRGKGDKIRVVFLSDNAREAMKKYLDKRHDTDPAMFVRDIHPVRSQTPRLSVVSRLPQTSNGVKKESELRLTPRSIERMVKFYAAKAGITKRVTPHQLRHAFATDLLRNGADIRSVQALLGHSHITTTQIYTHVTDKSLREIHQKFHGKNRN